MVEKRTAATFTSEGMSELSHETIESNERAVTLFQHAIGTDGAFAPAHVGLANAYVQRADDLRRGLSWLELAVVEGQRALQLDSSLADAYYALGRAYRVKGWLSQELQLWQRLVQLEPNNAVASERLGWVLWFTGRADEGLPWLRAAAKLRPQNPWVHFYLGNANLARGDYSKAHQMYLKALQIQPDHSSALAGVIWSLLAASRVEEARSFLRQFQTGTFDGDRYPLKLADIEYFLGEDNEASRHAQEALAEPPRDSTLSGAERYWPRGFLASTILGAILWHADRASAEANLDYSERIDRERVAGGDEGYLAHIDLAAVQSIRGEARSACHSLRIAIAAGWRYGSLAAGDRLFENIRTDPVFRSLVTA